MLKKIEGVLLDLNETEREAFAWVLTLAEGNLEEMGRLSKGDGRYQGKDTSRKMVMALIDGLREELDLVEPAQERRDVEAWRRDLALKRDDHFVNSKWVKCVYDRCGGVFRSRLDERGHVWEQALRAGWMPYDWKLYGAGAYSETTLYPAAELVCVEEHDDQGCPLINGPVARSS